MIAEVKAHLWTRLRETKPWGGSYLPIGVYFAAALTAQIASAEDLKKLDALCKEAGARLVATESISKYWSAEGLIVHFSFSPVIDTCVATRSDYLRNKWGIQDVTGNFTDAHILFDCDQSGVGNALLDRVRRFHGRVYNLSYREWMDDGEGGLSNAEKVPSAPYTRDQCDALFKRKLLELRLLDPSG
jgi:hypothetical protein